MDARVKPTGVRFSSDAWLVTQIRERDGAIADVAGHGIAGRVHGVTGKRLNTDQNSIVTPAPEPGSIAGGGVFRVPTMDPGSSDQVQGRAGVTMLLFGPSRHCWRLSVKNLSDSNGASPGMTESRLIG